MHNPPTGARVVVWGAAHVDISLFVEHLPALGETVSSLRLSRGFGGKGANQAISAAVAGADVQFIGRVGQDAWGSDVVANLSSYGVAVDLIDTDSTLDTGLAVIVVDTRGDNHIVIAPGASAAIPDERLRAQLADLVSSDVVVVQCELPSRLVSLVVDTAARAEARVILNLAPFTELPAATMAAAAVLVLNEGEAAQLAGLSTVDDPARIATELSARYCTSCVITLGAAGSVLAESGREAIRVPAAPVQKVLDTTGAGDAFVGTLAASISLGQELVEAMLHAATAAARVVEMPGAQPPATDPTRAA